MSKSQTIEDRKKYATYIGDQELETVEFKYEFRYVDAAGVPKITVYHRSDVKLDAKQAWAKGLEFEPNHEQNLSQKKLVEVREIIIASGNIERPIDAEATADKAGEGHQIDATCLPENATPATSSECGGK